MVAAARGESALALRLPALIDSTARAVVQCGSGQVVASGSWAVISHELLRTMVVSRWLGAGTLVLAVGAAGGRAFSAG